MQKITLKAFGKQKSFFFFFFFFFLEEDLGHTRKFVLGWGFFFFFQENAECACRQKGYSAVWHLHMDTHTQLTTIERIVESREQGEETRDTNPQQLVLNNVKERGTHTHTHTYLAYTWFLGSKGHEAGIRPAVPVRTNQSIRLRAGIYSWFVRIVWPMGFGQ